ncbi:MAG: hypothetical protein LBM70_04585 [Victivallales bacterium]|jgi:hypothetical protein|nr:hypothetical protein [Victivallales bacterium]
MRQRLFTLFAVLAALYLGGCADPEVMSEILQQKQNEKIYTRYNLWYLNPEKISCLNIQQGTFLPLGSEIEPLGTSYSMISGNSTITFRDMSGKKYSIEFDPGYRLCTLRDYLSDTFTTTPPGEMLKDIPSATLERIKAGQVVAGMTRRDVLLAYGPPPAARTPNLRNETWLYYLTVSDVARVIFRGDTVRNVLNINE